jgi:TPR repeat protein
MSRGTELLRQLILLRHDPELAAALRAEAMKGDHDAQYGLGLVYAEGRGVEQDEVEAYAWLSVAALDGDPDAEALREVVVLDMKSEEVRAAVARAAGYVTQIDIKQTRH